jgi:hypothetical protein
MEPSLTKPQLTHEELITPIGIHFTSKTTSTTTTTTINFH